MERFLITGLILSIAFVMSSCAYPWNMLFGNNSNNNSEKEEQTANIVEPTSRYSLAVGGVISGRDELVLYDSNNQQLDLSEHELSCESDKPIVVLEPRPGFSSMALGSGALITPFEPGITKISCTIDNEPFANTYEIIIPPQNLIQILVAEAQTQIQSEATLNSNSVVSLTSNSNTALAIGMTINNRIDMINETSNPALFNANILSYSYNPTVSYYDAVIMAPYQFAPTSESDPSHTIFNHAQDRNFMSADSLTAYDQAVLSAALIFSGEATDPTGGSFAFSSPNSDQWNIIMDALQTETTILPYGSGIDDSNFPAFAPLQIVIINSVWTYEDGRPSFIFIRGRNELDPAVVRLD